MAKLYFVYSAMNAGKSTTLLQASFNYRERGMRTVQFTAAIDDRVKTGTIASRIGLEGDAMMFDEDTDLRAAIEAAHRDDPVACVFIDEAQFMSKDHVFQLAEVVDNLGIPVICYGLRTDFRADLFEGSRWLLALADEIRELKTICECGSKATMNLRVDADGRAVREGESIEIGGDDRYVPLCRKHFFERVRND
ncbi:MAG: thymidine kinase [Parvularculaceae bacterium]